MGTSPITALSLVLFVSLLLLAVLGPVMMPYDPLVGDMAHALQPPSRLHWCGTDPLGRDVLSRVVAALRLDLSIALAAVILSFSLAAGSVVSRDFTAAGRTGLSAV